MYARLAALPVWAAVAVRAAVYGAALAVDFALSDAGESWLIGALGGIAVSLFMWIMLLRADRETRWTQAEQFGLTDAQLCEARAAAASGRTPDDPAVLEAAIGMVAQALARKQPWWRIAILVAGLLAIAAGVEVTEGPSHAWGMAVVTLALVAVSIPGTPIRRRPLERRLASLEAGRPLVH